MVVKESLPISSKTPGAFADYAGGTKPEPAKSSSSVVLADSSQKTVSPPAAEKNTWQKSSEAKAVIESLQGHNSEISIVSDPKTRRITVTVVDSRTGETILHLPLQDTAQGNGEGLKGLLLDTTE